MFLDTFDGDKETLLQGAVFFPRLPGRSDWWQLFARRGAVLVALRDVASAFRIQANPSGAEALLSVTVRPAQEARLRAFLAGFAWLDGIANESVVLPDDRETLAAWMSRFPPTWGAFDMPELRVEGGGWVTSFDHLASKIPPLMEEASVLGYSLGYQVNFRPYTADAEMLRRVGRNLIALKTQSGVVPDLVATQTSGFERLRTATLLAEEFVATDNNPDAKDWLGHALARMMSRPGLRLDEADFSLSSGAERDGLESMLHHSLLYPDPLPDPVLCHQADDERLRAAVLAIRPPARLAFPGSPPDQEPPPAPIPPDLPLPALSNGPKHIFVSYRRADIQRVLPILSHLAEAGLPIWFDRGIAVGDDWVEVLERKIEDASLVLIALSQSAIESKYCRREIKFADALDKPLLPVLLEAVKFGRGLSFTLHEVQQISVTAQDFYSQLVTRARHLMNGTPSI